jgi:hypothetical protein
VSHQVDMEAGMVDDDAGGTPRAMVLFDFRGDDREAAVAKWRTVGDPVMGGRSVGSLVVDGEAAAFRGVLSLARGGGFASVRASWAPLDLSEGNGLEIAVRGDGRMYKLNVRDDPGFDTVLHRVEFVAPPSWTVLRFPFAEFRPTYRGRRLRARDLRTERVCGIGLMIADRIEGPFRMEIARIATF